MGGAAFHDDRDQPDAVPLNAGHQRISRRAGISGLSAEDAAVVLGAAGGDHLVPHGDGGSVRPVDGRREMIDCILFDGEERRIPEAGIRDPRHVSRGSVMIRICESVRISEIGIGAAQLPRSLGHALAEGRNASGDMLRQSVGDLVRGLQKQPVKAVVHGDPVSGGDIETDSAALQILRRSVRKGDNLVQTAVFQNQKRREDLRDGSRIKPLVCVFLVQELSRRRIVKHSALCGDLRLLRREGGQPGACEDR